MPIKTMNPADLSKLLDMVLLSASEAGAAYFRSSPYYTEYEQQQKKWSSILKTLDQPTVECYENTVSRALAEYQSCFEDRFWVLGLINAIEKCVQPDSTSAECQNKTDILDKAENHLNQMCKNFADHLSEKNKELFAKYIQYRKNCIALTSSYCCEHGKKFMYLLLERVGSGKSGGVYKVSENE